MCPVRDLTGTTDRRCAQSWSVLPDRLLERTNDASSVGVTGRPASTNRGRPMRDPEQDRDGKPGQMEPTDNSTGAPVDLDRVHEVEQTERDDPSR
jgi:hypothetical protein